MVKYSQIISSLFGGLWACIICLFLPLQTKAQTQDKVMHPAPAIDWSVSSICYGDTTYFTNNTTGEIYDTWTVSKSVSWGDSILLVSSSRHLKYFFPEIAIYKVKLEADNGHLVTLEREFPVNLQTEAFFDYYDCNSKFTNLSMCYTSCVWDFGDGSPPTNEINPSHFFALTGTYPVSLVVYNGSMKDSIEIDITSQALDDMVGGFTTKFEGDSVMFQANDSVGNAFTEYIWSFGDGATADNYGPFGEKVWHRYAYKDSLYTVFLYEKAACNKQFSQQTLFVPDNTPVVGTTIYPNPLISGLHIKTDKKAEITEIRILNYLGQELPGLQVTEVTKGYDLDFSVFPGGLYFLKIFFTGGVETYKIVKH
jgi:hypothetical protein